MYWQFIIYYTIVIAQQDGFCQKKNGICLLKEIVTSVNILPKKLQLKLIHFTAETRNYTYHCCFCYCHHVHCCYLCQFSIQASVWLLLGKQGEPIYKFNKLSSKLLYASQKSQRTKFSSWKGKYPNPVTSLSEIRNFADQDRRGHVILIRVLGN